MLVVEPARLDVRQRRRERQLLRLGVGDELRRHRLIDGIVEEVGDALIGELVQARHVGDVRDDGDALLLALVDDRRDHLGRELRVGHPDLDEVDLLRFQVPDVGARLVRRRRLERRRAGIRAADVEALTGGVRARREERAGCARLRGRAARVSGLSLPAERIVVTPQRSCASQYRFMSSARLVDMAMHIDEAGQQGLALGVDDRRRRAGPGTRARGPAARIRSPSTTTTESSRAARRCRRRGARRQSR